MPPTDEDFVDEYVNAMRDAEFEIEHREGSNMSKYMTPDQAKVMRDLERQAAIDARSKAGISIFHRIRD